MTLTMVSLIFTTFSASAQSKWAAYGNANMVPVSSRAGMFSALMPGTPTYTTKQSTAKDGSHTTLHQFSYGTVDGNYAYLVAYNDYNFTFTNSQINKAYDDVIQGGIQSMNARVVRTVSISQDGYPSRITRFENNDYAGVWKITIVGRRLYQAMFIMRKNMVVPEEAEKFFTSFHIG